MPSSSLATVPQPSEPTDLSPETIDRLKAAHPGAELRAFASSEGDLVVCKAPSRGEYKRFLSMVSNPDQRSMAPETLFLGCVVHPEAVEVTRMLERRPGLGVLFGSRLSTWAGSDQEVVEKKL